MSRIVFGAVFVVMTSFATCNSALADDAKFKVQLGGETHYTGLLPTPKGTIRPYFAPAVQLAALPEEYDSEAENFVTPVKDQGPCGSCSFFARVAGFEAANIRAGRADKMLNLSEQDHMVNDKGSYGCQGGFMDGQFVVEQGVTTETLCPYKANDGIRCAQSKYGKAIRWGMVGASNRAPTIDELRQAIYTYKALPITVAASGLRPDANGRITGSNCNARGIDHMVTAVGYRPAPGGGYELKVKNSWGTGWGAKGYYYAKPGCSMTASDPGDAAMFYWVEGEPGPQPQVLDLPYEYVVAKGRPVAIQVIAAEGVKYKWSNGGTGARVIVTPTESTTYTVKAFDAKGNVTEQATKVTVK